MAEEIARSQVRSGPAGAGLETDAHYELLGLLIHEKTKARLLSIYAWQPF